MQRHVHGKKNRNHNKDIRQKKKSKREGGKTNQTLVPGSIGPEAAANRQSWYCRDGGDDGDGDGHGEYCNAEITSRNMKEGRKREGVRKGKQIITPGRSGHARGSR